MLAIDHGYIRPRPLLVVLLLATAYACDQGPDNLLEAQPATTTGVDFINSLTEDDTINILFNEYLYNGGGVGVGDFDGNGLPDLFFAGNMVSSRLYLQHRPWKFTDATEAAGLTTKIWVSGVNVHDINGDGREDLYLTTLSARAGHPVANLLFINQGPGADSIPTFREAAAAYGLADSSYSIHSTWFDLDADGDLDLYLLKNALERESRKTLRGPDTTGRGSSVDVVYRNLGTDGSAKQHFALTRAVAAQGWGLGVVAQDFTGDGITDLYVANDFISDDLLLVADRGGKLQDLNRESFTHTSKNSMGVDAADLNNDGLPDIVTADMLPDDNLRQKTMFSDIPFQYDATAAARGYTRQYVRNTLQLNNGDGTFSDIAFMAGIAATDWSWTPLLADLDNDGYRDVFISNGYPRDVTNRDFVDFAQTTAMFGTQEIIIRNTLGALASLEGVHQPNYVLRNNGDLTFTITDWIPAEPTYSNGAVYVDLDLDGDLDLVTNNLNETAGLYRNHSRERDQGNTHYLTLALKGPAGNPDALGAKVYLTYGKGRHAYAEQQRQRGYLSTMDARMHFGLGTADIIDTLLIVWPNTKTTLLTDVAADRIAEIDATGAVSATYPSWAGIPSPTLRSVDIPGPPHHESNYSDFDALALAVRDRSREGPCLAALDLDSDGLPELVMGGSAGQAAAVYRITGDSLSLIQLLGGSEAGEATSLTTLDFDGDGDTDLYIANGSSEFTDTPRRYTDLLYENTGGRLLLTVGRLPDLTLITSTVVANDLEGDGDTDLFVGSSNLVGKYPRSGNSYVLINEGGKYSIGQALKAGLVTDAVWADLNGDRTPDLVTVGEFSPPLTYYNIAGVLEEQATDPGLAGLWYSLTAADLDEDGDLDLLAGNLGSNSYYRADADHPLVLRVADYDNNGSIDPILMMYNGEESYPVHPRNTLGRQVPGLKKQATSYAMYGHWKSGNMPELGDEGFELRATELRSAYLENDGSGRFSPHFLPNSGQTSPIRDAISVTTALGRPGLLVVQNDHAYEVLGGRMDAGTGFLFYLEDGKLAIDPHYWSVRSDARSLVNIGGLIAVGSNNAPVQIYRRVE